MKFRTAIAAVAATLATTAAFATPVVTPVYTETGINMVGEISNPAEYTLDMTFTLHFANYWQKLVDFNNRTADAGLYLNNDVLSFYTAADETFSGAGVINSTSGAHVTLTRDNAGLVSAYVNGALQFSFADTTNSAVFAQDAAGTSAWLLADDVNFGGNEQAVGTLTSVHVFDHALSAQEVAGLHMQTPAVPEPSSLALLAAGALTVGSLARRRQIKG